MALLRPSASPAATDTRAMRPRSRGRTIGTTRASSARSASSWCRRDTNWVSGVQANPIVCSKAVAWHPGSP